MGQQLVPLVPLAPLVHHPPPVPPVLLAPLVPVEVPEMPVAAGPSAGEERERESRQCNPLQSHTSWQSKVQPSQNHIYLVV